MTSFNVNPYRPPVFVFGNSSDSAYGFDQLTTYHNKLNAALKYFAIALLLVPGSIIVTQMIKLPMPLMAWGAGLICLAILSLFFYMLYCAERTAHIIEYGLSRRWLIWCSSIAVLLLPGLGGILPVLLVIQVKRNAPRILHDHNIE